VKPLSTTYRGERWGYGGISVRVSAGLGDSGAPLGHRLDLQNHSPTGFEWGYGGSGPSQLALAILADFLEDDAKALAWYQPFKWRTVAQWERKTKWQLSGAEIVEVLAVLEAEAKGTS
jgi:uncharacterized protein DUF6166